MHKVDIYIDCHYICSKLSNYDLYVGFGTEIFQSPVPTKHFFSTTFFYNCLGPHENYSRSVFGPRAVFGPWAVVWRSMV